MTANPASILDSMKKGLGVDADDTSFDVDLVIHINSALGILRQIGVGNDSGYAIEDNSALWTDYSSDITALALLKSYILLKVRLWFDPPQNAKVIDSSEKQIVELESRINMMAEQINPPTNPFTGLSENASEIAVAIWWNLTGLSDFPPEASVGDLGYDLDTGDVWRKT